MSDEPQKPKSRRWRWLVVAFVLSCVAALFALRSEVKPSSTSDEAKMCRDCFAGINAYNVSVRSFPKDQLTQGKELSWRFFVEPLIEDIHSQPYDHDASWKAEVNRTMAQMSLPHFCKKGSTFAQVLAVRSETVTGPFPARRLGDVPRDLILFVVVKHSPFHWMQPGDADIRDLLNAVSRTQKVSSGIVVGDVLWVCFADGTFWALRTPISADTLRPFLSVESARSVRREEGLARLRLYDSSERAE